MNKKIAIFVILLLMLLSVGQTLAQPDEEYWAREFMPLPNQVVTFNGPGDDGNILSFITIYYAKAAPSLEPDYWVSEYNIFPGDSQEADFVPHVSADYYLNERGLWRRTPLEKSQGMAPALLLPYKFCEGQSFAGRDAMEFTVLSASKTVQEHGHTYSNCLELISSEGEQIFYMAEVGLVLGRGGNEQWMVKRETLTPEKIRETYKLR